jgi:hypothetical protein
MGGHWHRCWTSLQLIIVHRQADAPVGVGGGAATSVETGGGSVCAPSSSGLFRCLRQPPLGHQLQEDSQSLSIAGAGIELDSGGKQCCLIKALKAFSLAFSRSSCFIRRS